MCSLDGRSWITTDAIPREEGKLGGTIEEVAQFDAWSKKPALTGGAFKGGFS
jgi:hypothetical protein